MQMVMPIVKQSFMITIFVFIMMIFIDYLEVLTKGKMSKVIRGGLFRQYVMTSFLGTTPGCLGAFMNVSFYVHGLISFGAIVGSMIATSGDEAFVMLALIPEKALLLFGILFFLGIIFAYLVDKIASFFKIKTCHECGLSILHSREECHCLDFYEVIEHIRKISFVRFLLTILLSGSLYGFITDKIGPHVWDWKKITFISLIALAGFIILTVPDHYLEVHIWDHIAKKHLWKIFLWTFSALLLVNIGLQFWNLEGFVKAHMFWVLFIAGLTAVIPESGPNLIFVTMFAKGLVPFSVLLTSSIVQDGHGMLPLLSYTIKDSLLIKLFNLIIGLGLGLALFLMGY